MKSSNLVLILILIGFLCFVMAACVLGAAYLLVGDDAELFDLGGSPRAGQTAPDFQLQTINGKKISLHEFRGKPVMVNFWAVWCGPCIEEMPVIQSRYQRHYPDLVVLAIEETGDSPDVRELIAESDLSFIVLAGSNSVARQYNISAYPTSFFIDEHGVIQAVHVGSLSGPALDEKLTQIGVDVYGGKD